ncbi:MAG TPA: PQQ-binding-like beta-propeller repeat protein [Candidatus Limnocylindria bacterium]|jgi:outer membrane protein assembly factor BamB|nr:PQQ-binding-like beta-propeller repeat protein [Candidatus Limnocylindria bacterium]
MQRTLLRLALASLLGFAATVATRAATNWPQYRGPTASGVDESAALPTAWNLTTGENIRWKVPIAGLAHSSPIVWGDRVYVATAVKPGKSELKVGLYGNIDSVKEKESHQWRLLALDKPTGKVVWDTVGYEGLPKVQRHTKSSHCNSTPATDGEHIVAIFGSEGLFCFDVAGKLVWKKDLGPMDAGYFDVPSAQWGFASSPVIHEGKVIVLCDVQKGSFLAAFNLADGRELWRTPRKDVPTWGTPAVVAAAGRTQVVVNGWHRSGGYDFTSGKELWNLDGGGDIPVPSPIFADGLLFLTSAHGKVRPMRAIRPDASGDITPENPGMTNAAIAWAHARQGNYMQTPLAVGGSLYGCLDIGVLTCFDTKTGVIRYSERLSKNGEGFTSSPVSDGRHLYFTSELGNVYVVPADGKFALTATNSMEETVMSTPAISDGLLLFRTRENLVAIGRR